MSAKNRREEEELLAKSIKTAREFTACLHLGPGQRHVRRGLASYEAARAEADELEKLSKFGRKAVVYAISAQGYTVDCSPRLMEICATL